MALISFLPHLDLLAIFLTASKTKLALVTTPDVLRYRAMQAPSQRPSAPVSLSHEDPVVKPNQSSAGAVGRSAVQS